ncbi:hypothetical protein ANRL1_04235 [Anaerolineae bacterium]|nr:hypothetical protein ANRL1_04235 [Anaerolineae bacterium]
MSYDKPTRNALAKMVGAARQILKDDITKQLQSDFRLQPDGTALALDGLTEDQRGAAIELRELLEHYAASEPGAEKSRRTVAFDRLAREIGFTILNRLAALRLCEERGLVIECVRKGMSSDGVRMFDMLAHGALGTRYQTYRVFIENLFDELALDLGALFDRRSPLSRVFPSERALEQVLALLNDATLTGLWREDETIGWIYQYYNDEAERKQMRDESQAPRNSRELAVRNQFFTPRYVVEFLTDNTLGRIWYEMQWGRTKLKDDCRYLVRRPAEVFLGEVRKVTQMIFHLEDSDVSEKHYESAVLAAYRGDLTQIENDLDIRDKYLIAAAIPPSEVRRWSGVGPADFEITQKVWDALDNEPNATILNDVTTLWMCLSHLIWHSNAGAYFDKPFERLFTAFVSAVKNAGEAKSAAASTSQAVYIPHRAKKDPREILMLDPAGGSGHFGLYCFDLFETIYAEAYDDPDLATKLHTDFPDRDEFLRQIPRLILEHNIHIIDIDPRACQIAALALWLRAQRSWQKLNLKPEARPRVRKVNVVCAEPMPGEKDLLEEFVAELEPKELGQLVRFVFERMKLAGEAGSLLKIEEDLRDEIERVRKKLGPLFARGDFWDNAEARVLEALRAYAEQAANGHTTRRRLFADDAAQGFAFIDLCRKKYEVVLMNPPFGSVTERISQVMQRYKSYTDNIISPFAEYFLTKSNLLGMVIDRSLLIRKTHEIFRRLFIRETEYHLLGLANWGWGALDAYVEVSSLIAMSGSSRISFVMHPDENEFQADNVTWVSNAGYKVMPNCVLSGEVPDFVLNSFSFFEPLGNTQSAARVGHQWKSERFLRLWWEGNLKMGPYVYNGGTYSPYLFVTRNRMAVFPLSTEVLEEESTVIRNLDYHMRPGIAYGKRGVYLDAHLLPARQTFTVEGLACFPKTKTDRLKLLAFLNSAPVDVLLSYYCGQHKHVGYVNRLPYSSEWVLDKYLEKDLGELLREKLELLCQDETSPFYSILGDWTRKTGSLRSSFSDFCMFIQKLDEKCVELDRRLSDQVARWLEFPVNWHSIQTIEAFLKERPQSNAGSVFEEDELNSIGTYCSFVLGQFAGFVFGRWDIRIACDPTLASKLQDPFDPLPVYPPGMLVGTDGLPAKPNNIVSEEWLRARPNAITLPDVAKLKANHSPLTTTHYPLTIAWDGILVDDAGLDGTAAHSADIVRRVREALAVLWGDRAQAIEDEACTILGVSDLRDYFRKPTGFFADHLKRYSKSRRQAPIYLPLSTTSGRYTVWVYYHRFTKDTLYTIVNQYVEPKIESVDKRVDQLAEKIKQASGKSTTDLREQLNDAKEFLSELREFRTELLRVSQLPYKPDLNDGVIITVAPLCKLFRLRKWATDTAAVWKKLEAGEYDWSHMAYNIWTSRVEKKCETDRSIAIAHGLEHLCKVAPKKASKAKRKKEEEEEQEED